MIIVTSSKPRQIANKGKWSPASFFFNTYCTNQKTSKQPPKEDMNVNKKRPHEQCPKLNTILTYSNSRDISLLVVLLYKLRKTNGAAN